MTILMENRTTFEASNWLLVCRTDETDQYRGGHASLDMSIFLDDAGVKISGLQISGLEVENIVTAKEYALLAKAGDWMLVIPSVIVSGFKTSGARVTTSFISTSINENQVHYVVWKLDE